MTNREQMAAGFMIAMGLVLIWWVSTPSPSSAPEESLEEEEASEPSE